MALTILVALLAVGGAVGFVSGLVGIGGGVLIVPFLYFFYGHPAWSGIVVPAELQAAVAHATSLFIILPTAVQGTLRYHRDGLVAWPAALPVAVAALVAAVLGARLALGLPPEALKLAFGLLLLASAARLALPGPTGEARPLRLGLPYTLGTGTATGLLSALLGVGGGVVAIPLLIHLVHLELRRVAATSLAVICFAALSGTATYVLSGWRAPGLPGGSLGYVHLVAAVPMLVGAMLAVRAGVWTNRRLGEGRLRLLFGLLMAIVGIRLVLLNVGALAG
ncbi:MAG TPA: sulfite exporter TauE/SafE family protein [Longimicrobiales bacterium]|nr:sulfite exporter TauE/SafE family protein [Longimicrobiales bacterium]